MMDSPPAASPSLPQWWQDYRQALDCLPADWEERETVLQACGDFEQTMQEWEQTSGDPVVNVAVVGPKNAGKSFLIRELIRLQGFATDFLETLPVGWGTAEATRQLTWLGHEPPVSFDPRAEHFLETPPLNALLPGQTLRLLDVPGFNERKAEEQHRARLALAKAVIKILVVPPSLVETREWGEYLQDCQGGWVFPVMNAVRGPAQEALAERLRSDLAGVLGHQRVLPPCLLPDFGLLPEEEQETRRAAELKKLLTHWQSAFGSLSPAELRAPERAGRLNHFREVWGRYWEEKLPQTQALLRAWPEPADLLPGPLAELYAPPGRVTRVALGLASRGHFLSLTSSLLFPWKGFLGLAHLLQGAWQKIPFLFLGSVPAALGSAGQALRNAKQKIAGTLAGDPAEKDLTTLLEDHYRPHTEALARALQADLKQTKNASPPSSPPELTLTGTARLTPLARQSLEETLPRFSPGRISATLVGLGGMLIFWGIFIWPLFSLYVDYFQAARQVVEGSAASPLALFPRQTGTVLGTAFLLALFPLFLWIVITDALLFRRPRLDQLDHAWRTDLRQKIEKAFSQRTLTLKTDHPLLNALPRLFLRRD